MKAVVCRFRIELLLCFFLICLLFVQAELGCLLDSITFHPPAMDWIINVCPLVQDVSEAECVTSGRYEKYRCPGCC